jgi:hypothetical protein
MKRHSEAPITKKEAAIVGVSTLAGAAIGATAYGMWEHIHNRARAKLHEPGNDQPALPPEAGEIAEPLEPSDSGISGNL